MSSVDHATLPIESSAGAAVPDWSTLDIELHCPRCDYNLKMLTSPRCPECGLTFEWDELIRATRNELHVPIFEYQWRTRPVQSFFETILRCMFPWTLWRRIPLAGPVRSGVLLVFVLFVVIAGAIVDVAAAAVGCFAWTRKYSAFFGSLSTLEVVGRHLEATVERTAVVLPLVVICTLGLAVMSQTLRSARIRAVHLVRVASYAFVAVVCWRAAIEGAQIAFWSSLLLFNFPWAWNLVDPPGENIAFLAGVVSIALAARHYLRISTPELAVLVIVLLMMLALLTVLIVSAAHWGSFQNQVSDAIRPGIPATCQALIDAVNRWR